jgi:adenylate cyclase
VAGVIGTHKFAYDIWGDTVNTASRMESHSLPGRIQVSATTRSMLGDRFDFEPRGTIEIKGKGAMETFFMNAR